VAAADVTVKELLTQEEITALLELSAPQSAERSSAALFNAGLSKVAKGVGYYLQRLGLQFDAVTVQRDSSAPANSYRYEPDYPYLGSLSIENTLALGIIAARFGAKAEELSLTRALTSLEQNLMEDLCKEISYMVEKELDDYLVKDDAMGNRGDYGLRVAQGELEYTVQLSFTHPQPEADIPEPAVIAVSEGTKVEALLGSVAAERLQEGMVYAVHLFGKNSAVLLLDGSLPYRAKHLHTDAQRHTFVLQEAIADKALLEGYCLCIAASILDDAAFLALDHGTVVALNAHDEVEIHKNGKLTAKGKLFLFEGDIRVRIYNGKS
jgi:hypothetical protein